MQKVEGEKWNRYLWEGSNFSITSIWCTSGFSLPTHLQKVVGCRFLRITQAGQFFAQNKLFSTGKQVKENRSELGKQNTPSDLQTQLHKNHTDERGRWRRVLWRDGWVRSNITLDPQKWLILYKRCATRLEWFAFYFIDLSICFFRDLEVSELDTKENS